MTARALPFLFDLDGTLADTIGDIAASTNAVRRSYGLPAHDVATIQSFVGHGAGTLLRRALAELELGDEDPRWAEARARYTAHHDRQCTVTARLYPGVLPFLDALRARGHRLGVVTNKPERFARAVVAHLDLDRRVEIVIGGDTLAQKKPDPAPVLAALRRLGGDAGAGTMVGDGETDLRAGKAAGLRTIACLFGYRPAALLRAEGADEYWTRFGGDAAP
ncbi:MAG: HAD family hydrolase [Planctomycetota bacterium]